MEDPNVGTDSSRQLAKFLVVMVDTRGPGLLYPHDLPGYRLIAEATLSQYGAREVVQRNRVGGG